MHPVLMFAETPRARDEVVSYLRQGSADGALIVSTHAEDPLPGLITDAGLPAVLYARPARPVRISYVDLANREGAGLAAEHLLARGCRRIATITGPLDVPAGQERLAGFRDTMARRGHPYIPIAEGQFTQESGEAAMERLLTEHPDLDGVFAGNDLMAMGACHVLREHGRRVPSDVAVIGFDDSSAASACSAAAHDGAAAGGGHGGGDGATAAGPPHVTGQPCDIGDPRTGPRGAGFRLTLRPGLR